MIRWSYAINQFKPQFDDFARRRQHQRALRIVSVSGFDAVELTAGTGRWEPLGNPDQLTANFGSPAGFGEFVREAALQGVSSWYWDPSIRFHEDLTHGHDPLDEAAIPGLIRHARWFAGALAQVGGDVLVVRPAPSGAHGALDDEAIARLAHAWTEVAHAIAEDGVRLALHFDFLSALRLDDGLERLLAATGPEVGLALDTAEFAIAGIDPVGFLRRYPDRVTHVHLKNATVRDELEEFTQPAAEYTVLRAGGSRVVPRWFLELGEAGLVDASAFVSALVETGYAGWVVVESDFTPHPATSVMLNGWQVQRVLRPLTESAE